MRTPPCLETARLRLRPRRREDIDALVQMDLDPEVYRYSEMRSSVPTNNPDRATLRKRVRSQILSGTPRDTWVVEWKDQPGLLGLAGLAPLGEDGTNLLGFRFVRSAWGQGIATEAARVILDHGFRVLKCPTVIAFSHTENGGSSRVLDKIGMERDRMVVLQQNSLLNAPQSRASARTSDYLNMKGSLGSRFICYRLERGTYLNRVDPPTASPAQPDFRFDR
ncbi:GNAT family N-acetyltransferase [Methylocella sp.]|jgi:RimJ/RimL family protein N-acetyltransferase|uniref:GNAT family N-acetyltransferase n=1 Tax=Methylocella sp. TaxID=1978226 RepID=UPI003C71582C